MVEGLMLAVVGVLTVSASLGVYRAHRRLSVQAGLIERSEAQLAELRRVLDTAQRLALASAVAEGTVEGGTRLVQGVHQGVAAIPFSVLEAIPVTRGTAKIVRKTHDTVAGGVYTSIAVVNKWVGRVLRGTGKAPDQQSDA